MEIAQRNGRRPRSARPGRPAATLMAAAVMALSAASCGNRYFTATVSGYVKETGAQAGSSGAGINAAEIRVYLKAPTAATIEDYVVKTSTMTSGGQDGYWSHKVMWENWFPSFPDEGDSTTVYVWVKRPGYFPVVIAASGILSDSTNVVPTIELERISMAKLRGRVVNRFGQGVDGIRLILNLDSSPDLVQDYAATTAQAGEGSGYFEFNDIGWIDPDSIPPVSDPTATPSASPAASPAANVSARSAASARSIAADGTATETASLYVDDPAYYGAAYTKAAPLRITLTSGATLDISTDATRRISVLPAQFARETLEGRVVDPAGAGLNGVSVSIDLASTSPGADYTVQTLHLEEKPAAQRDGWYRFTRVSWTDQSPEHPAADAYGDTESVKLYVDDAAYASSVTVDAPKVFDLPSDPENTTPVAFGATGDIVAVGTEFSVPGIRGQVVDGSGVPMNGVTVTLDLQSTAAKPDATAVTATVDGVAGTYLFPKTPWTDAEAWKTEADPTLWTSDIENADLYVVAGAYASGTDELHPLPILLSSGTMTAVAANIVARKATFRVPLVEGRIVNGSGTGINGITVALNLESTATNQDATATTQDSGGQAGWFRFTDVLWTDAEPETPERERFSLSVPEGDWNPIYLSAELTDGASLTGGTAISMTAVRRTYWSYSATVSGRILLRRSTASGMDIQPLSGMGVHLASGAAPPLLGSTSVPTGGMDVQTDANGAYSFTLNWTMAPAYVPAGPNGGDSYSVDLTFADDGDAGTTNPANVTGYSVQSWVNPNRVSDKFFVIP